jgi:hypothetical protein
VTSSRPKHRRGLLIDGLLVVLVLATGAILLQPGVFSVDESHYLLAADAFAREGSFHIENGYERYHAPELLFFYTVIPDEVERLGSVSTVPPYHAVLAAPYLRLSGLTGLFILNLICFAATCVAVRRLASRLQPDGPFPVVAAAVFAAGSFGLEYALGIWPHALSQVLIAWSLEALLCAVESKGRRAWILAGLSGLLAACATGVRMQNIVMLPILVAMARWALGCSGTLLTSHLAGWIPPLLGYSLINLQRQSTLNPFTYGSHGNFASSVPGQLLARLTDHPWMLAVAAAGLAGLVWLWRRARWKGLLAGMAGSLAALLVWSPPVRTWTLHWLSMTGFHLLDTVFMPAGSTSIGSTTSELGQILYGGVLKKGLLEVAPFLVMAMLVLFGRALEPRVSKTLRFLGGTGLLGLALLPLIVSTGGFCFNPRYLLEFLPALVVVSLYFSLHLVSSRAVLLGGILLGILLALPGIARPGSVDDPGGGLWPMLVPLLLALGLLVSSAVSIFSKDCFHGVLRQIASGLLGAALAYGILIQLGVDLNRSLTVRYYARRILEEGREVVPSGSLLLAWEARKDVFSPLKLDRDVLIAGIGPADGGIPDLVRRILRNRRVFLLKDGIPPDRWAAWSAPYRLQEQERHGLRFVELRPGEDPP